ncbi:Lsr2 family protein [Pseudonocardia sp. C8]|uniref:histone-like nucleoid-structuring protein Lsr2 n=1 Tax=Pseudonocardia sp. C8 TaxID=2762759 RepID=UPI001642F1C5|nr:Lsr2 family protein [Pseudonocardia sp. C8]
MAQVQTVRLVDDLTGDQAEETILFGIDGTQYEIDLSSGNASALRDALAPFVMAARSTSTRPGSGHRARRASRASDPGTTSTAIRQRSQAVRAWARQNGYAVSERGRISAEIVAAYDAANKPTAAQRGTAVQFSG